MRIWYNNILENSRFVLDVKTNRVRIGRRGDNDIVLNSPYIAEEAVVLTRRGGVWELTALGVNGCQIGDRQLREGDQAPLASGQTIQLFPFTLTLDLPEQVAISGEARRLALDRDLSRIIQEVHLELLDRMNLTPAGDSVRQESDEQLLTLERNIDEIAKHKGLLDPRQAALAQHVAGMAVRGELLGGMLASAPNKQPDAWQEGHHWSKLVTAVPEREQELKRTAEHVADQLGLKKLVDLTKQIERVEQNFWPAWDKTAGQVYDEFKQYLAQRVVKKEIKDVVFGYGPLEDLLRTPTITEIMVVDRDHIYIEKNGVLENSGRRFISDEVTLAIIERIVARVGRRIDKSHPLVDARLTDGSRVNAVIPPLTVSGPCLTIRKFPARKMTVDDLVSKGSLTRTVAEFLRAAVLARKNILISGGTGTGKTTLLNCLSDFIPNKERIVTIEDTAELQLKKEHVVRMETKAANVEGAGAYSIRDLVKNSLRMRPDRIVVGECRGAEALDMLQAMNTGHDGSMTTVHANSAEDVILRLEVLVQMAAALPIESIHRQIASAIDLVVQLSRLRDGSRRVTQITEYIGIDPEEGGVRTKDLFLLEEVNGQQKLMPTGCLPTFMDQLIEGNMLQLESFYR